MNNNEEEIWFGPYFNALASSIVMAAMLAGSLVFLLKGAGQATDSELQLDYFAAGLVFLMVYTFATYRLAPKYKLESLMFGFIVALLGIMSAAGCSMACWYDGPALVIPFQSVLAIPLFTAMGMIGTLLVTLWTINKVARWVDDRMIDRMINRSSKRKIRVIPEGYRPELDRHPDGQEDDTLYVTVPQEEYNKPGMRHR